MQPSPAAAVSGRGAAATTQLRHTSVAVGELHEERIGGNVIANIVAGCNTIHKSKIK
jgi:hypothetical protein